MMFLRDEFSLVVVVIAGLYLLALGAASLVVPARASRFLLGFAGSKSLHFFEIFLRFLAGAAFVFHAPSMSFSTAFSLFGWVLLGTTVCLLFVPWRWHYRFAQKTVPYATNYIALLGLASLAIGGLVLAAVFGGSGDSPGRTMVGQVLLPSGFGSRGVEIQISVTGTENDTRNVWVLFDEQGRFAHPIQGSLTDVRVAAGIGAEVHRIDTEALPEVNQAGQIDLGVIDLRDQLSNHRMVLRAAEGKPEGDVRVAMWFGLPPVGPEGEPVSLGSRQFPPVALGSEVDWLLSHEAHSIYFLVERPSGLSRGAKWRSGHQRLFGPFNSAGIPAELIMD